MTVTQEELGRRIRDAREACRMTQNDSAKHIGVSRPTFVQIEAGKRSVSSLELDKLAYLFGLERVSSGRSVDEQPGLQLREPFRTSSG
jgi:DNA-binding XRE family transcriptional regulator